MVKKNQIDSSAVYIFARRLCRLQTAYFEISDQTEHGEGLICSFVECRKAGIKFRYCTVCKDAIAKRNFRNSHHHVEIRNPALLRRVEEAKEERGYGRADETALSTNFSGEHLSRQAQEIAFSMPHRTYLSNYSFTASSHHDFQKLNDFSEDGALPLSSSNYAEMSERKLPPASLAVTGERSKPPLEGTIFSLQQTAKQGHATASNKPLRGTKTETEKPTTYNNPHLPSPQGSRTASSKQSDTNVKKRGVNRPPNRRGQLTADENDAKQSKSAIRLRRQAWAELLTSRPRCEDDAAMTLWIQNVLRISDLNTPITDEALTDQGTSSMPRMLEELSSRDRRFPMQEGDDNELASGADSDDRPSQASSASLE